MRLTPDWEYDRDSAALVKLPSSTVLTNAWYFWMLASIGVSFHPVSAGSAIVCLFPPPWAIVSLLHAILSCLL